LIEFGLGRLRFPVALVGLATNSKKEDDAPKGSVAGARAGSILLILLT